MVTYISGLEANSECSVPTPLSDTLPTALRLTPLTSHAARTWRRLRLTQASTNGSLSLAPHHRSYIVRGENGSCVRRSRFGIWIPSGIMELHIKNCIGEFRLQGPFIVYNPSMSNHNIVQNPVNADHAGPASQRPTTGRHDVPTAVV